MSQEQLDQERVVLAKSVLLAAQKVAAAIEGDYLGLTFGPKNETLDPTAQRLAATSEFSLGVGTYVISRLSEETKLPYPYLLESLGHYGITAYDANFDLEGNYEVLDRVREDI